MGGLKIDLVLHLHGPWEVQAMRAAGAGTPCLRMLLNLKPLQHRPNCYLWGAQAARSAGKAWGPQRRRASHGDGLSWTCFLLLSVISQCKINEGVLPGGRYEQQRRSGMSFVGGVCTAQHGFPRGFVQGHIAASACSQRTLQGLQPKPVA